MLPRTFIATDSIPYTALASHSHTLRPPQGPIYLLLGHTISILINTNSVGDTYNALELLLTYILHFPLLISDLVLGIGHGIF